LLGTLFFFNFLAILRGCLGNFSLQTFAFRAGLTCLRLSASHPLLKLLLVLSSALFGPFATVDNQAYLTLLLSHTCIRFS
jgi:hypothetical protein